MKTISFVNMKGGVAKTTLAVNMADFLVKRNGRRILFIDVDPQFNATQCLMTSEEYVEYREKELPTIVDIYDSGTFNKVSIVNGIDTVKATPYEYIKPYQVKRGFDLIPGNLDLFRFEMTAGQGTENRLKNYLKIISDTDKYDLCIIDCPPTPSVWMTSALLASDYYLIPSKPDPISMTGLDLLDSIIRERKDNYGCSCKCIGLVLTIVEKKSQVYNEAQTHFSQSATWKDYLYKHVLMKRTKVSKMQLQGGFISDIVDSKLNLEFSNIVSEFLMRLEV